MENNQIKQSKRKKKIVSAGRTSWIIVRFLLLFGFAFLILEPFVTKILMAFMSPDDLLDASVNIIPRHPDTYYWKVAWEGLKLSTTFFTSVALSILVCLVQFFSSALVGYGLSRFKFKANRFLFFMVVIIMLVPSKTYAIAQYLNFRYPFGIDLSLIDTMIPMFIMNLFSLGFKQGLYIYLFMTFFKGLPKNLEDAAYIDGAGSFRTFLSVILPNSRAVIATVIIFSFSWQWTDTSYASRYFSSLKVVSSMISEIYIRVNLSPDTIGTAIAQNAACMILILPILCLFVFGQKFLTQSISRSGLAN